MALYEFPYRILTAGGFEKSRSSLFDEVTDDAAAELHAGELASRLRTEHPRCTVRISRKPVTDFVS